jgi:hypothetical protein
LDGPLPKLYLSLALSHQDGHQSAVALLLKAALIQVSDYRLLGASCFNLSLIFCPLYFNISNITINIKKCIKKTILLFIIIGGLLS